MNFGERLKELRIEKGLTQIQLAKILDISKSNISKYEAGSVEPNLDIITKCAVYFDVYTDFLLGLSDNRSNQSDIRNSLEWKYPDVSNRLGNILKKYRQKENLSEQLFSEKLNISIEIYIGIEVGKYTPSFQLLQKISEETKYDIDYLTGAIDHTSIQTDKIIELNNHNFPINNFESDYHFKSRFEELCQNKGIDSSNVENSLGLTKQEYIDVRYNRMPTLSELLKISYALGVSMDYLIGKNDIKLSSLSGDELNLILNYRECLPKYKENICQRAKDLSIESLSVKNSSSVAADNQLKKTGTDNLGK